MYTNGAAARPGRPLLWWDIAFVGLSLVMAFTGIADTWPEPGMVAAALLVLALLVLGYLFLGRPVLRASALGEPASASSMVFIVMLIVIVGAAAAIAPSYATLQTIAYPIVWGTLDRYRDAVLASGVLATAVGVGLWVAGLRGGSGDPLPAVAIAALSFAFAVAMGSWITRIFERGERYRALAEQLRSSQQEISALSTEAGAAAERERLSRELHDTLTQTLTGLVMLGEQADRALAAGRIEQARERLERVQLASRAAVEEARALVATTHPLGDGGLEQAIERVAASLRNDAGLPVRCRLEALPLDRERQVVLLRAAQEGLANARRHAHASEALVALREDGGCALLTVEDDGIGPDPAHSDAGADTAGSSPAHASTEGGAGSRGAASGFGLRGLRDRVRLVGGEVRFGAREGGGSLLEVRVPLAEAPAVPATPEGAA